MKTLTRTERDLLDAIGSTALHGAPMETRNSDSLDFHDVHVETLRDALEQAYRAGRDYEAERHTARR